MPLNDGDALVLLTSGSTGKQKQVVHTHSSIEASAKATNKALEVTAKDKWLAALPLCHIGGLSVILRARQAGIGHIWPASDDLETEAINNGCTLTSLVTRQMRKIDTSVFRKVLVGGGPAPERPDNVWATYGMTETGSGIYYKETSGVGHLLGGAEIEVRQTELGQEVFLAGPMLCRGYRQADGTVEEFGKWLATGDGGDFTNGQLSIHGRLAGAISTGGETVWPEQLEKRIKQHPQVQDCLVTGEKDPEWGQRVVATLEATEPVEAEALRAWVTDSLPAWYVPKQVTYAEIPRTPTGKPRRSK